MDWTARVLRVRNTAHHLTRDEVVRFGQHFWSNDARLGPGLALAGVAVRTMSLTLGVRLDDTRRLTASPEKS